ncbi:hypothetical protein MJH12_11020, partial [bacterium]|nr:hypothetical protein [bacterium]
NTSLQESSDYTAIQLQMGRLDADLKVVNSKQKARQAKLEALNAALLKLGIKRDVSKIVSMDDIKAFMLEITKKKINKESKLLLANQLTDLVHLNISVLTYLERAVQQYNGVKKRLESYVSETEQGLLNVVKWIESYDRFHKSNDTYKSYAHLLQSLLTRVQDDFKGRVDVLNTPFLSGQAKCRKWFPKAELNFSEDSSLKSTATFVRAQSYQADQQRLICYADYEISIRKDWDKSKNNFLLQRLVKEDEELHFNVKNIETEVLLEEINLSVEDDTSSSIFEGLLKILDDTREISSVKLDAYMKEAAKIALTSRTQGIIRVDKNATQTLKADLGKDIHEAYNRAKSELKVQVPKEGVKAYSGLWLGLTIGAKNLRYQTRKMDTLTGEAAIDSFTEELSRYLGENAREYLERRVLMTLDYSWRYRLENNKTIFKVKGLPHEEFLENYKNSPLSKAFDVVPSLSIGKDNKEKIGFGYGNVIVPGTTRYLQAQSRLFGFKNWLLEYSGLKYRFNHKKGNIYQVFIPLYKLEQKPGATEGVFWEKSVSVWDKAQVIKTFSEVMKASKVNLEMQTKKVDSIDFADVLYLDGVPILDGTGQEIDANSIPGIKINYKN